MLHSRAARIGLCGLTLLATHCKKEQPTDATPPAASAEKGSSSIVASSTPPATTSAAALHPLALDDETAKTKALEYVATLNAGKYDDAVTRFDEDMAKALPKEKVREVWEGLVKQLGGYKASTVAKLEHKDKMVRANVTVEFETAKVNFLVVLQPQGKITGFFVKPIAAEEVPYAIPAYAKADTIIEQDVIVGEGEFALPGTLTLPKGDAKNLPAVVLVHGSGPQDRDETVGALRVFRDLALGLTSQGIAVLRYEKVTKTHGAKIVEKWGGNVTLANETLDDALKGVALLRKHARIDPKKVVYLGHSQGALAAPRAGKTDVALAGLIIMASPTRAFEDVALAQFEYIASLPGPNGEATKKALPEILEAVKLVKSAALDSKTPKEKLPLGIPASFWLDLKGYKPEVMAAGLKMPILVLQGEADYQVTMADFEGWKKGLAGKANATLKSYPGLHHGFADCGCKLAKPDSYSVAGNVAAPVIDDLVKFIKGL